MEEIISSPPFPGEMPNASLLYRKLAGLRLWLVEQQEILRLRVPSQAISKLVEPDNLAAETVWTNVSVPDQFGIFVALREIRELWDAVIREHDDSWDSQFCVRKRFAIVVRAQFVLNEAFVSSEAREMKREKEWKTNLARLRFLNDMFRKADTRAKQATARPQENDDDWSFDVNDAPEVQPDDPEDSSGAELA